MRLVRPHEFTRMVDEALTATDEHVFGDTRTCRCGFTPTTGEDWLRHLMEESLAAALKALPARVERG